MSAQLAPEPGAQWLRWFPAAGEGPGNRWRLIRFERVDEAGNPVGKPITNTSPGGQARLFLDESSAKRVAALVNEDDGL